MSSLTLPNINLLSLKIKRVFFKHILLFHTVMTIYVQIILKEIYHSFQTKKNILFDVGGEVVAKSVLECTQYSECRGRRLANKGHFQNMPIAVASGKNFPH